MTKLNRLHGTRCYLSGAMEFTKDVGVQWRKLIKKRLEGRGIIWLDPTDKPIELPFDDTDEGYLKHIQAARERGDFDLIARDAKLARHVDLRLCDMADHLIVNLDLDVYTVGTWEEVVTSNRAKKPIIVRVKQGKKRAPFWLLGMIPHEMIFSDWDEIVKYLDYIDTDKNLETFNRWLFFNI